MCNDNNDERRRRYNEERRMRHEAAQQFEEPSINLVRNLVDKKVQNKVASYTRYDEEWFEAHDINDAANEWVKGASDYLLSINNRVNDEVYAYVEIKYKTQTFRKTVSGGITRAGSVIPNYGCESYYLDIIPVWRNICDFINRNNIPAHSFWIAFINEEISDVRLISAARIGEILQNGWNGQEIGRYGEGYGQVAYLIPENATVKLTELTFDQVVSCTTTLRARP